MTVHALYKNNEQSRLLLMPDGRVGSLCGVCREFMMRLSKNSRDIEILVDLETYKSLKLSTLVPDWWGKERFE